MFSTYIMRFCRVTSCHPWAFWVKRPNPGWRPLPSWKIKIKNRHISAGILLLCRVYAHSSVMVLWTRLWGRYHVPQNVFLVFLIFQVSGPCARLCWPSRQLLRARYSTVSYRTYRYHNGAAERRASTVTSRWERRYTVKAVHIEDKRFVVTWRLS